MSATQRQFWIPVVTAAGPFSLGAYRVLSLAARNELTAATLLGELLGALILAILFSWTAQFVMSRKWLATATLATMTLAIASLVYLPQGVALLTGILLVVSCQLLIFLYAATSLKPRLAKAFVRTNRRLRK